MEEEVQGQFTWEKTLKTEDGHHSQRQVEAEWDLGALPTDGRCSSAFTLRL